jgi:hypothetical protein
VVCLECEVEVSVCGCEVSLYCICIYRCIHLKEFTVGGRCAVTDAGISMVISQCNQMCKLYMLSVTHITGMCALCEDSEPTLCFIILLCIVFLPQANN